MSGSTYNSIFGGSNSKSNYSSSSTPVNMQNSAFSNLAPGVAQNLSSNFFGGPPSINPLVAGVTGTPGFNFANVSQNPLVAPMTGQQGSLVNQAFTQGQVSPQLGQAGNLLSSFMSPSFINPSSNPFLQAAISGAVRPMITAFNESTMPAMQGQFTAAGQNTNNAAGSSAFDRAATLAQSELEQNIGNVASQMENQGYQFGVGTAANAANQAMGLSQTELGNTLQALQGVSLPQLIQQYGINQGLQLYQNGIQSWLQALGLGGQISQPVVANKSQSSGNASMFNAGKGVVGDMNDTAGALGRII